MATHDLVVIKHIGKAIGDSGNERQWHETAEGFDVMRTGLRSKSEQHSYLRRVFLSTGDSILGEANQYDSTEGIGMSVSNLIFPARQVDRPKPSGRPIDGRDD